MAMGRPLRDTQRHTYGEYLRWPEDVHYELIEGEAYPIAPAPTAGHQRLVGQLFRQIADALEDRECGCRGAPDWVIEVLTPATAAHDQTVKLAAYERAGVRECWLVHPADRTVTVYAAARGSYGRPAISELTGTLASCSVPAVAIDWARAVRDPIA